ncbi:MAG: endonuclease/exonuclease/phosphatase family protein, partial [Lachnospiraceae bacterium]|nr:endonuclease/exonuclease/phosphatase family protein [Lachnospiraceae bacterium]
EEDLVSGKEYYILSYNIGFGAYEPDYGFFMDGGTQSWAWSKERLDANMKKITAFLEEQAPDFALIQEVDLNSTRSYHRDEREDVKAGLKGYSYSWAQNWDSPFLFYPLTQPHGKSRSSIMTLSKWNITSALRRSLPIEDSVMKLVDLDRCYSVNRISLSDGHELVLINMHLSAYTSDGKIADEQMKMILEDMEAEYKKGNYVIAGGDFNKDLSGDAESHFNTKAGNYTWAQPIPDGTFSMYNVSLVFPYNEETKVPSCRNADGPYNPDQFVLTVDGFMVTSNIEVKEADVIDTGFACSDHNPVRMTFVMK